VFSNENTLLNIIRITKFLGFAHARLRQTGC
jgi:hypothetical protein